MASVIYSGERYDIGRVFGRTFSILGRRFVVLVMLGIVLSVIPAVVIGLWQQSFVPPPAPGTMPFVALRHSGPIIALGGLLGAFFASLRLTAVIRVALDDVADREINIGATIAFALKLVLPVFVVSLLFGLGLGLASIFLIVPGVVLAVMWSAALPAYVAEQPGIFAAFGRSRALTKGSRWRIFGVLLILSIAAIIIGIALVQVAAAVGMSLFVPSQSVAVRALYSLVSVMIGLVFELAFVSSYVELRNLREGMAGDELATIFS